MDKKDLYQKAEKAINQAFEMTKKSVKIVSEKAGEAASITKLLIEKATLEHKVTRKFSAIGNRVYKKAQTEKDDSGWGDDVKVLIADTKKLEEQLTSVEGKLAQERNRKNKKKDKQLNP